METIKQSNEQINRLISINHEAIQDCLEAYRVCMETIQHCLTRGGQLSDPELISAIMDCGEYCKVTATLINSNSDFSIEVCQICAKICQACASNCESVAKEDHILKNCALLCRRCAESCVQVPH
jgi:hypothetical protein